MAKARATCTCKTCGATFIRETIKRSRSEADSWEAWAAENIDTCPDCYRAQQQKKEKSLEAARNQQLPQLLGSEKQVAWANAIRNKMISENQVAKGIIDGEFENPDGSVLTFQQAQELWTGAEFTESEKKTVDSVIKLFTETQAKWFIDHRFDRF